ncbi:UNVERIFIED_CONTAM: hypothetical protein Sradi_6153100 [Sesamum radiatum]|uniref:CCHC-type domain-containing protein n=1 Tax=Sesamum radiatum TaxID=300843 RepID=A0AAW2K829_SESRA
MLKSPVNEISKRRRILKRLQKQENFYFIAFVAFISRDGPLDLFSNVCMHCQGKGHWKRECPQLLSNSDMFVIEVNMITNSTSWVLDTGCRAHICNNLKVLDRNRRLSKDEMILRLGHGKAVAVEVVGY